MTGFGETLKIVHYEVAYMVTKLYRINAYHPDNWLINDFENINVDNINVIKSLAKENSKGLIARVFDDTSYQKFVRAGFKQVRTTYFAQLFSEDQCTVSDVFNVAQLDDNQQQQLLQKLKQYYENVHQINPASPNINYRRLTFDDSSFDEQHSIVRVDNHHITAAILVFEDGQNYEMGWTFGDNNKTLLALWQSFQSIFPEKSLISGEFDDTDRQALAVYQEFDWHETMPCQLTMLWH